MFKIDMAKVVRMVAILAATTRVSGKGIDEQWLINEAKRYERYINEGE